MGGVAIILSPNFDKAHKEDKGENASLPEPFDRCFLAISLTFTNRDNNGKRITLKLLLCSIYHLVDNDKYECFNTELDTILGRIPSDRSILIGHNMNANIGTVTPIIYNSGLYIIGPGK
jgi:hypothetical protein